MNLIGFLKPKPTMSDQDVATGLRWLTWEGTVSLGFNSITTSGFLAAFALALGANNLQIGILAAIPFIMQILQIPAIWLVEKLRKRKAIAVTSWFSAQLLWFPIALIPVLISVPGGGAISMLLGIMAIRGLLNAVCNSAWNGWVRDLVPQPILGRFFSRRLAFATMAGVVFSLGAAFFVDYWRGHVPDENMVLGYTYVLLFGALFLGLASPTFMSFMPEPLMQPIRGPQPSLRQRLTAPIKDSNFRRLIQFLLFWGFASNMAIPFFAVYMLVRLGLPLSWVIGLSILSQMFNMLFLRVWGSFVDRFGNKAILSVCASLYLLVILGWIFTTMPERYFMTMPLLVLLHIFAGIATAGVTLTVGTIGLKLAPRSEATPYLAGASLATNLGAGLGPLLGGLLADFFSVRQLNLTFTWTGPAGSAQVPALSIIGLDFLFGIAFILGLMTLGMLAALREEGEVSREVILESLMTPMREFSRPMSSVPAYNLLSNFPFGYLKRVPIPGLDVALGVTIYQIAGLARTATLAAVRGRRLTKKLVKALGNGMAGILRNGEKVEVHGVEITQHTARGAMHVVNEKPMPVEQLVSPVIASVVKVFGQAGVNPLNGISGASHGIIQGAAETGADLGTATIQLIEAVKDVAVQTGLSERLAVAKAAEGALQAAEAISPEAMAKVRESLPPEAGQETARRNQPS
jgi:MFS family permease